MISRLSRILSCLCLVLCSSGTAWGLDAPQTAERLQNRYAELKSFAADFEQTLTHRESGAVERRSGKLRFQKPLLIRWETDKPHQELLVVGEKEIWDYLPDEELAYRYPLSMVKDSRGIIQVITGQAALTRDFDVRDEGPEGPYVRLRLYPKEPEPHMVEAVIRVDAKSGYIQQTEITDFYGNKNEVRFTSFSPGARFSPGDFRFSPPRGVDVEDHTGKKTHERQLFN
jgi:outer membrane lipoprotein carrier protein